MLLFYFFFIDELLTSSIFFINFNLCSFHNWTLIEELQRGVSMNEKNQLKKDKSGVEDSLMVLGFFAILAGIILLGNAGTIDIRSDPNNFWKIIIVSLITIGIGAGLIIGGKRL